MTASTRPRMPEASAVRRHCRNECGFGGAGGTITYCLRAEPQNEGRDEHEHAGNSERDGRPELPQKHRHQERSEERAEIDDPVERVEHDLRAMLVRLVELVADERCHARLDPAGAERDQPEPDVKAGAVRDEQREAGLTHAIDQTQPEDRVVFAEEPVGQPAAEQREKINADDEGVEHLLGRARARPPPADRSAAT